MSPKSFQVLPKYIQQVKSACKERYADQKDLAKEAKIGANTVSKFLNGKPVTRENFCQLCDRLGLDWKAIASPDAKSSNAPEVSAKEGETGTSNGATLVGREKAIGELQDLVKSGTKIILIYGEGGVGKSVLFWQYWMAEEFDFTLELWMAKESKNITPAKSVVEEWLRRHFNEKPNGDFPAILQRLEQKLKSTTKRIAILIDNLEPALDKNGNFISPHRDYVELLKVLSNPEVNCLTFITSREKMSESDVNFHSYRLQGLDLEGWQKFFTYRYIKTDSPALKAIHSAYAGNTKAMHIISSAIQIDWQGDIDAYWQANAGDLLLERDLQDLVVTQFNRLQEIDPQAYKLLCRLGCYRYQDVRAISLDGVWYLLWDVLEVERTRVFRSLCDRSLVDFYNGEYWLHPVIRAEAIARLRASQEWDIANRKAAEYWTESVQTVESGEDARKALEAYYHYIEINDFELAAEVILKERKTPLAYLGEEESLNDSFDRLGLLNCMVSAITCLIDRIDKEYILIILYGYLGAHYHRLGNIQKSLECSHKSRSLAIKSYNKYPKTDGNDRLSRKILQQSISNLLSMGGCKSKLGETEEAMRFYEQVKSFAETNDMRLFIAFSCFGMAILYSDSEWEKQDKQKAYELLEIGEKTYAEISVNMLTTWSQVYSFLVAGKVYRNLGENEKALAMFEQTLICAEESKSRQVKGQALHELAVLYRNLNDFETAISKHQEGRQILQQLGAEIDLAALYYQMGLTYQKMGDVENSNKNFQEAMQLFEQIEAPKQVEKVQRAMKNRE